MATLDALNDIELVESLRLLETHHRKTTASIIEHLVELERRKLPLSLGYSSTYEYCMRALGLSEDEAYRRITVARMAAREPAVLAGLADGSLQLSGLVALSPHFRRAAPENAADLLAMARGVSRREVERRLAARFPLADAPDVIRGERGRLDPLSPERFLVQVTVSAETKRKLERALELMSHQNPSLALAPVLEAALEALIEKLERARRGKLVDRDTRATATEQLEIRRKSAPPLPSSAPARTVPRPLRRAVFEQADAGCSFVSAEGHRCNSRYGLEIDHENPWFFEKQHRKANLRLLCRAHNQLMARSLFGSW